jgi:hypothetical protein
MKGKKKGKGAQALLAEHAEKIGFGVIALLVVGIWASEFFGGAWAREKRNPTEMIEKINQTQAEIERGVWPEDKRAEFALVDFSDRAATLLRPINASRYELSTEVFVPLNRPKEKAREPDLLVVENLITTSGHVILSMRMTEQDVRDREKEEGEDDEDSEEDDMILAEDEPGENSRRDGGGGGGNRFGDLGAAPLGGFPQAGILGGDKGGATPLGQAAPLGAGMRPQGGKGRRGGRGDEGLAGGMAGPMAGMAGMAEIPGMMAGGMGGGLGSGLSGQKPAGRYYVAVRGVFPVQAQLEKIRRALHLPVPSAAQEYFQILDLEIERQIAVPGDDPWSGEWEQVDLRRSLELLEEVDEFDAEPVDMAVLDPTISLPLPRRALGYWTEEATHPRIKNYELSPEAQARVDLIKSRLMEQKDKMKIDENKLPQKGGFAALVHDMRGIAGQMNRANPGMMSEMYTTMGQEMRQDLGVANAAEVSPEQIRAEVTAVGQLLLFRYFDFDVRPGYAYRYRVRLVLQNPNYQSEVTDVTDPSVIEGATRETDWSEPSEVSIVDQWPKYFLHTVDSNPLVEEGRRHRTVGTIKMFEWHKELGTRVAAALELDHLGQFIGGEKTVEVLDVTTPELTEKEYPFTSDDMLLDVRTDTELLSELHPDLGLKPNKKPIDLGLAPEVIVLDQAGDLDVVHGSRKLTAEERRLDRDLEAERKPFEDLRDDGEEESELDNMPFAMKPLGDPGREDKKDKKDKKSRKRNPLRKQGGGAGASAYGAAAPMGPGGAMMPSLDGKGKGKGKGKRKR